VISQVVGEGRTDGTHAVPRVTSVNPGACKYKRRAEPWVGDLHPLEPEPLCVGTGTPSAKIPWFISGSCKACVGSGGNRVHHVQSYGVCV
jgi:hypothetical protein